MLRVSRGCLTGSATLQVLMPYELRCNFVAPNLNIVVPLGELAPIGLFLAERGYTWCKTLRVAKKLLNTVESCLLFKHSTTGQLVIVTESIRPTVLNVIIEGRNTATMNIITSRNIFSLYPAFTARGHAFCGVINHTATDSITMASIWNIDLRNPLTENPFPEGTKCGVECGRRRRRLGGRGIGLVCWNPKGKEDGDVFGNKRMYWMLNEGCLNPGCQDKEPELYQLEN